MNKYYTMKVREVRPSDARWAYAANRGKQRMYSVPYLVLNDHLSPEDLFSMGFKTFVHRQISNVEETTYDYDAKKYLTKDNSVTNTVLYLPLFPVLKEMVQKPDEYKLYINRTLVPGKDVCKKCENQIKCKYAATPLTDECTPVLPIGEFEYKLTADDGDEPAALAHDVMAGLRSEPDTCTYTYKKPIGAYKFVGLTTVCTSGEDTFNSASILADVLNFGLVESRKATFASIGAKSGITRHLQHTKCKTCFFSGKYVACARYADHSKYDNRRRCWMSREYKHHAPGYVIENDIKDIIWRNIQTLGGEKHVKNMMRLTSTQITARKPGGLYWYAIPNLVVNGNGELCHPDKDYVLINANERATRIKVPYYHTEEQLKTLLRTYYGAATDEKATAKYQYDIEQQTFRAQSVELYVFALLAMTKATVKHETRTHWWDDITNYVQTKNYGYSGWGGQASAGIVGILATDAKLTLYFRTSGAKHSLTLYSLVEVPTYISVERRYGWWNDDGTKPAFIK